MLFFHTGCNNEILFNCYTFVITVCIFSTLKLEEEEEKGEEDYDEGKEEDDDEEEERKKRKEEEGLDNTPSYYTPTLTIYPI